MMNISRWEKGDFSLRWWGLRTVEEEEGANSHRGSQEVFTCVIMKI